MFVARIEAFEFGDAIEGGVLHAFDFGDVEEAANHLVVEDFTVGGEHLTEFEGEDGGVAFDDGGVDRGFFGVGFSVQAAGLEKDGRAADLLYLVHLAAVEGDDVVAGVVFDVGAGDERSVWAQGFARPEKDIGFFSVGEVVDVAGVHVDGVLEAGGLGGDEVFLEFFDGYLSIVAIGEQSGGYTFDFAAGLFSFEKRFDRHVFYAETFDFAAALTAAS